MDDASVSSLLELVVFELLKDVNGYTEAFNAAVPYLRTNMHKCAKKYYETHQRCRYQYRESKFISWIDRKYELFNEFIDILNGYFLVIMQAYVERNYVFLLFEFDNYEPGKLEVKIDGSDSNYIGNKKRFESTITQYFEIAVRMHYHQYEQCLIDSRNLSAFDLLEISRITNEYDFAYAAWQFWHEQSIEITSTIYEKLFNLMINNALENEKWSNLCSFTINSKYNKRKFTISGYIVSIFQDADAIIKFSEPGEIEKKFEKLSKMRRNVIKLFKFSKLFLKQNLRKIYDFDGNFKDPMHFNEYFKN